MVDTIKFSQMTAGGDLAPGEMTPGLMNIMGTPSNVLFNNPWTFLAPGSTADRPVPSSAIDGRLRFNTDTLVYEYYDTISGTWVELSGSGTGTVNPGITNAIAYYTSAGTIVSGLDTINSALLVTSVSGVPSFATTLPVGITIPGATITTSTAALTSGQVVATPVNPTDIANKAYVDSSFAAGVASITGAANQVIASSPTGNVTLSLPQDIAPGSTPSFVGLTLSSIPLGASSGGTGVNNGSNTLTLAGTLATAGAFASTFTMTGATNVTFPTSGTLATTAGTVSSVSGTANQIGSTGGTTPVISLASNPIVPGTGGIQIPGGTTAQRAGAAGTIRFNSQLTLFESTVDGTNWATIETSAIGVTSISGTANQVIASSSTGAVTLSLPQSIGTGNSPTFAGLTLTNPYIAGSGGVHSFQVFTTGTAQTYTKPSNVKSILIEIVGGGGAGGSSLGGAGAVSAGSGGGSGGYARLFVASASATYTYTVGAGGTPGAAGNNAGGNGGTSTFSASSLQATGGNGGSGMASIAVASTMIVAGSSGGIGTNGNINSNGGAGLASFAIVGNALSGKGGDSHYSGGGAGVASSGAGLAGTAYGAGGSGGVSGVTSAQGGAGAAGLIIVWEFA